ncbi:MAG TPA: M48 family metalloprotease [Bryobacteraceae bacterium]|jgi:predicted Zn-dependent protease|nr:M48 family metalloprotease [Bryobacteraceae bacterium]
MRSAWCIAFLTIGIAQGQRQQPGQGVNFYSRDKEVALGEQLAQEFRQGTTPLGSAAVDDYVKRVGANLAAQLPGGWTFTFETIRDERGGPTHEPIAFPGGPIFVSADLIVTAQNEAEFAGMLAHAMAHVVARRYTRQLSRENLGSIQTASLPVSAPGTAIPMGLLAFRRANESEADYWAVKAMAAAGYDPAGLASYVDRVQPDGKDSIGPLPPRDWRVAAIEKEILNLPAGNYISSDRFDRIQVEVKRQR